MSIVGARVLVSCSELQVAIAHKAVALPLVVPQRLQLGGELRHREWRLLLFGTPALVSGPQVLRLQRLAVGMAKPLPDEGRHVGRKSSGCGPSPSVPRTGSLGRARPHREDV